MSDKDDDNDFLSDTLEVALGSDQYSSDSDNDGLSDTIEFLLCYMEIYGGDLNKLDQNKDDMISPDETHFQAGRYSSFGPSVQDDFDGLPPWLDQDSNGNGKPDGEDIYIRFTQ